jgi:hypothetical protein
MRLLAWGLVACVVLVGAHIATRSTDSALVALSGVFVAAQLVGPVLVDWRRLAATREAPSAHRARGNHRRGAGAVAWVRLDTNPEPQPRLSPALATAAGPIPGPGSEATMRLALSARRTS